MPHSFLYLFAVSWVERDKTEYYCLQIPGRIDFKNLSVYFY